MNLDQIKLMVDRIFLDLLTGMQSHQIMATLRSEQTIETFNRYGGFFAPTWLAHRNVLAIKIHNITTSDKRGANFKRVWAEIEQIGLGNSVEIAEMRAQLVALQPVVGRVWRFRHTRAAHYDFDGPLPSLLWGEIAPLLDKLQSITERTGDEVGKQLLFMIPRGADTSRMLGKLR